jgi:hypothetical protein
VKGESAAACSGADDDCVVGIRHGFLDAPPLNCGNRKSVACFR